MLRAFLASEMALPRGAVIGVEEELRGPVLGGDLPDLLARLDLIIDSGNRLSDRRALWRD